MLTGVTRMDIVYVAIQQLHILLSRISADITRTATFGHIKRETFSSDSLIFTFVDIVIDILDGRNLELACMSWHSQKIIDDRAFQTISGQLALIGHFGIILVEVLGEFDFGLFQQLHITQTADNDT